MEIRSLLARILERYELPLNGYHGVAHWARVLENGLRLVPETGASLSVVTYFAVLHDSQRRNEHHDPDHGPRAARFAEEVRSELITLDDDEFQLLVRACEGHTHERTHPDVTVQTCWDSDRLDLGRVGITPHASRLCTEFARRKETIDWAHGRACMLFIPGRLRDEWGIELD